MKPQVSSALHCFIRHETGSVLSFWAVTFAAFLGLVALSFDFGRLASTQSELQSYADNVALAAAGELNGKSDSITRALSAAETFISDTQTFGDGDNALSNDADYDIEFFQEPPTATSPGSPTSDPTKAGYVEVTSVSQSVSPVFGAAFSALTDASIDTTNANATAVAGYTQYACDVTPLMFCAPNADYRADEHAGSTVLLRAGGPNAAWGPGAFGFLDPSESIEADEDGICAGLSGAKLDICLIAASGNRNACFSQNGVNVAGGQRVGNFEAALNIRFDIYHSSTNNLRNNANYPPAPNVMSNWEPATGNCIGQNGVLSTTKLGLSPDDCHATGLCDRFGDGDWSTGRQAYIDVNYNGTDPFPEAQTRYEVYLAEIEALAANQNLGLPGNLLKTLKDGILPQCSSNTSADANRRVLVAASIDCTSFELQGGASDIPVIEFVELFMIAPIGLDGSKDIWVEIIGGVGGGSGGSKAEARFREVVQLYK
ncbi:putative Flp pilus-assembly TadE/G-like protein [Litoreibacter ponti]|uniref:Putative Flp pilus-assembly TadE/G-like protein n=1 Tax=Litoreibacter ponti TaxID=1510457 RepID=A0A2T6BF21_9RHOB|nr:Tad domain-containing protein [Litoreibacter ponti]PTX54650.1 putative Flp pilus-assembly TadE/G-like protein [Litoreibacter ponti]